MLKICAQNIENCPPGMENNLDNLMMGIIESQCMSFIKTSLKVYGRNENEILEYAKNIKTFDSTYDIVEIFSTIDTYTNEREYIKTKQI